MTSGTRAAAAAGGRNRELQAAAVPDEASFRPAGDRELGAVADWQAASHRL
jgi:hypothetical protein